MQSRGGQIKRLLDDLPAKDAAGEVIYRLLSSVAHAQVRGLIEMVDMRQELDSPNLKAIVVDSWMSERERRVERKRRCANVPKMSPEPILAT